MRRSETVKDDNKQNIETVYSELKQWIRLSDTRYGNLGLMFQSEFRYVEDISKFISV